MIQPFFSVIIPIYNRVDLFGDTLQSVINQEYKHWELILVDDGSNQENISAVKDLIKGIPNTHGLRGPRICPNLPPRAETMAQALLRECFLYS